MKVLATGGAGYVGSTVASACLDAGIEPVILDDLVSGRVEFTEGRHFYRGDIADAELLDQIFSEHPDIEAVVHCAALVGVAESTVDPVRYWQVNVGATIDLVANLLDHGCHRLLFSSTAALYRAGPDCTVEENSPLDPRSPYARNKAAVEDFLRDVTAATELRAISLRYFNLVGADPQLRTGQPGRHSGHLLGRLIEAAENGTEFHITGTGWQTRDGTGIRDFVHVWDLAQAHVAALLRFDEIVSPAAADTGYQVINLGTGEGTTVREMVCAFEQVTGARLAKREAAPRPGDVQGAYTRGTRARTLLGWQPKLGLDDGIRDSLRWERIRGQRLGH